jgi:hypothetical protein
MKDIVLSPREGKRIYEYLDDIAAMYGPDDLDKQIAVKIALALDIEPLENK